MFNRLIHIIAFGCLGTTTEVWFTATGSALQQWRTSGTTDLSLSGHSYVWMFFIYASAALLFPIFYPQIARIALPFRLLIYMVSIFIIEYLTGWLLDATTGSCPWHYDSGWAINGYIRLDYAPFWIVFGYVIERVFVTLNSLAPVISVESRKSTSQKR